MAESRADELRRYGLCIVGIGAPNVAAFPDGDHCKAEQAVAIIRELEERIAAMEDAAGPIVSDLHDAIDRRIAAEERICKLEAENESLRREMADDVEFQWSQLVDVPEDSLTPGGRSIRRQLIAAARKSLEGGADADAVRRERDAALADIAERDRRYGESKDYRIVVELYARVERAERGLAERDAALARVDELEKCVAHWQRMTEALTPYDAGVKLGAYRKNSDDAIRERGELAVKHRAALDERDEARRQTCYAKANVDPGLVRRIELIALRRQADAAWGNGEGKRLFPEPKETDGG
jgi:hypothetical protein